MSVSSSTSLTTINKTCGGKDIQAIGKTKYSLSVVLARSQSATGALQALSDCHTSRLQQL